MIGRITWPLPDGGRGAAYLRDDRTWSVPGDPALAAALDALYPPGAWSPADGIPGARTLADLAEAVGGEAERPDRPAPPDDGRVY